MPKFEVVSPYQPSGDQPEAIAALAEGIENGLKEQVLLGVTGVIVLAVLWALIRKIVRHPLGILACCLIISGGIGNIIDRLRLGYVVDMLHFQFWPSYPTFNVADICIVCGAILGAVYFVLIYEKHDGRKQNGATDPASGQ